MDSLKQIIPIVITLSLGLLVFSIGVRSTGGDFLFVLRRPGLLAKAVLAVCIIPVVAAVAMLAFVDIGRPAAIAILLMAISPVPPLVPGKDLKLGGRTAYVFGLYAALALISVISVPLLGSLTAAFYGVSKSFPASIVALNVASVVVLPLLLGIVFGRKLAPDWAHRAVPWIERTAMVFLLIALVPILWSSSPQFPLLVGDGTIIVIIIVVGIALAAGHFLGGEAPEDRPALAVAAATRHPGIAIALAGANHENPQVTSAILLFLLVSIVAVIPYQIFVKRRSATASRIG